MSNQLLLSLFGKNFVCFVSECTRPRRIHIFTIALDCIVYSIPFRFLSVWWQLGSIATSSISYWMCVCVCEWNIYGGVIYQCIAHGAGLWLIDQFKFSPSVKFLRGTSLGLYSVSKQPLKNGQSKQHPYGGICSSLSEVSIGTQKWPSTFSHSVKNGIGLMAMLVELNASNVHACAHTLSIAYDQLKKWLK